jgi:hypothetical protein
MPMFDYVCSGCGNRIERFSFRREDAPDITGCDCGSNAAISDDPSLRMVRPRNALRFDPIVVHCRLGPDGSYVYSYPGNPNDPVDPGYEKVELTTISQADRFVKDRNSEEQELRRMQIGAEKAHWDERAKERRENATRELQKRLGKSNSRIGELVARAIDARREKKYRELENKAVNFHIQGIDYDHSNRAEYRDDANRKISVGVNGFRR